MDHTVQYSCSIIITPPLPFFASSTSKFMQKKAEMQKKSRKCTFDFKIHAKKGKKATKKSRAFYFEHSWHLI